MPNATVRANAQTMPIDRRTALNSFAAAGALLLAPRAAKALPAPAAAVDPALAAIERHKAAAARLEAFLEAAIDDRDDETYYRLDAAERDAMFELADTVPTTHAGAYAALRYLVKEAGDRQYSVLGIFGASLIEAKWETFRPEV